MEFSRKIFVKSTLFAISVVFCLFFLLSCARMKDSELFSYTSSAFVCEMKGIVDGKETQVQVYCDKRVKDSGEPDVPWFSAVYLSPESMKGMVIDVFADGSSAVRMGENSKSGDFDAIVAPFLPICPEGEMTSREMTDTRASARYTSNDSDITYRFDSEGRLTGFFGSKDGKKTDMLVISIGQLK